MSPHYIDLKLLLPSPRFIYIERLYNVLFIFSGVFMAWIYSAKQNVKMQQYLHAIHIWQDKIPSH